MLSIYTGDLNEIPLDPVACSDSAGNAEIKGRKPAASPLLSIKLRDNYTL